MLKASLRNTLVKMSDIKFSILMPIYNKEECLKLYLPKIQNQTYKNFEVIMVDDNSEDNSLEVMNNYSNIDSRFKSFKNKKNKGVGYTRNELLKNATGEYIVFVDPDDYVEIDLLEKLIDSTKRQIDIIRFQNIVKSATDNQREIERSKNPYRFCCKVENNLTGSEAVMKWCTGLISINAMLWTYCIKKSLFVDNKIDFQDIRVHEDFSVIPLLLFHCKSIEMLDYVGYNYVQYDSSLTKIISHDKTDLYRKLTYKHDVFKSEVARLRDRLSKMTIDERIKADYIQDLDERLVDRQARYETEIKKLSEE